MAFPTTFANLSNATGAQLDGNFNALLAPNGSTQIGFLQAGTGAIARTGQDKLREMVSVKDFGAVGDGVADDTAAIQLAITASQGINALFFPSGTYKISGTLNVTNSIALIGQSRTSTTITWNSTTFTAISVVTDNQIIIDGITFQGPGGFTALSGAAISLTGSATANVFSRISNCAFIGGYDSIDTVSAYAWIIQNNRFGGYVNQAILVQNAWNADAGDSIITGNIFSNAGASAVSIQQVSSGGLKIINNKIVGGAIGYRLQLSAGVSTSDLLLTGNSIEQNTNTAIVVNAATGTAFSNVVINGNQIALTPVGISITTSTASLSNLLINNNDIALNASGVAAVSIGATTTNFNISGNTLSGSGGSPIGISIGASTSSAQIGVNAFKNLTTNISVNPLVMQNYIFPGFINETSKVIISANGLTSYTVLYKYTYFTGTTGASFAITFPAGSAAIDGQKIVLMSTASRAAVTWTSAGATFVGAPASLSANTPIAFQYDQGTTTWNITI